MLRMWEKGEALPSEEHLKLIKDFPENPPFSNPDPINAKFRTIDLFAGIGGIRLAFSRLGGYTVFPPNGTSLHKNLSYKLWRSSSWRYYTHR